MKSAGFSRNTGLLVLVGLLIAATLVGCAGESRSPRTADSDQQEWIDVDRSGTGVVTGWTAGSYSVASSPDAPVPEYRFDVQNKGTLAGFPTIITIPVGADDSTEFFIDSVMVKPTDGRSAASIVFSTADTNDSPIADGSAKVVISVHREGNWFVADKVEATSDSFMDLF